MERFRTHSIYIYYNDTSPPRIHSRFYYNNDTEIEIYRKGKLKDQRIQRMNFMRKLGWIR